MSPPAASATLAREMGLSPAEYERVLALCAQDHGRPPTLAELGMFAALWSEHCSYKSSRHLLKGLPVSGPRVLQGPGENAGAIDVGDGQAVVFKMESHNHPSFIEPYQGAATGVGGILRDVFTMGARPIACLDCLRFGRPDHPRTAALVKGVVAGIAGYGNAFGVPTVAGDLAMDECYDGNILVNAMAVGLCRADRIFRGTASGVGNPVLYLGQKTGRDGIHGATMASAEFAEGDAKAQEKRPRVQVGDPFTGKRIMEASLGLMAVPGLVVGIQDMGAAGLTSSAVEMAARAGSGIELDLDQVPRRETGMSAYEVLLSESQERMLLVVARGREQEALALCETWDIAVAVIGRVTDTGRVVARATDPGFTAPQVVVDLPIAALAEGPRTPRPAARPAYLDEVQRPLSTAEAQLIDDSPAGIQAALEKLLASPGITSKEWVYRQYDHQVRLGTVLVPGRGDAAVLRLLDDAVPQKDGAPQKGIAVTAGCNSRLCYLDPYEGTRLAVAECYRNLCAVGAEPLAVTDCLNFGNPERPEVMWQLEASVRGLGDACRALETPVVSGNVSLYNETVQAEGGVRSINPTPMIGMVGLVPDVAKTAPMGIPGGGLLLALLGFDDGSYDLGGSEYLHRVHGLTRGRPPRVDLDRERAVGQCCAALVRVGLAVAAHDLSEGGLLVALAESCLLGHRVAAGEGGAKPQFPPSGVGCAVVLPLPREVGAAPAPSAVAQLFHEAPGRYLLAIPAGLQAEARLRCHEHGVPLWPLGRSGGAELVVRAALPDSNSATQKAGKAPGSEGAQRPQGPPGSGDDRFREVLRVPVEALRAAYHGGLQRILS